MTNKELELTLNPTTDFPVLSMSTFLQLFQLTADAIIEKEELIQNVTIDKNKTKAVIDIYYEGAGLLQSTVSVSNLYQVFCDDQKKLMEKNGVPEDLLTRQADAALTIITLLFKRVIAKGEEVIASSESSKIDITNYTEVRENLYAVLVNGNDFDKEQYPYKEISDGLGYTARIIVQENEKGRGSIAVPKTLMETYGITENELLLDALMHTFCRFKVVAAEISPEFELPGYVLSLDCSVDGAISIMYPFTLSDIAKEYKEDLIIMLISTSEAICIPKSALSYESARSLCECMSNLANELLHNEYLTEQMYLYNHITGKLEAWTEKM